MSFSRTLSLASLSLTPALLAAQTVVQLDPVEVTAPRVTDPALTVPTLDAARAALALTPGGAEAVDAERYLRGRASTLADTFALSPGVFAQPRFGSDEARLSIRGSGLQRTFHGRGIRVLQDGVPLNLADGSFDMQAIEPATADYITVLRGANALAAGSSTLGGAIDYVSRTGRSPVPGHARLEAGSFGYVRALAADGGARDGLDAYAALTATRQDGFRDHSEQAAQRAFANAGIRLADTVETRFYLAAVNTRSELPGNLFKSELEADPKQAAPANVTGDQERNFQLLRVADKTTFRPAPDTTINLVAAFTLKDLDHPIGNVVDQLSHDVLVGADATRSATLADRDLVLRAGLFFTRGETDSTNYQNLSGRRGTLLTEDLQTATNLEAFGEAQLELGARFTGVAGFSAARNQRDTHRTVGAVTAANTYDRTYDELSPKVGLRWDAPAADVQLFANVSGSYEPPSFSESGTVSAPNRAQTATTFEVGSRGAHRWLRWDASVYSAAVRDELLSIQLPPPAPIGQTATINADRTTHQGIELGLAADLLGQAWNPAPPEASAGATSPAAPDHRLVLRGAWTYGRFKFDDDATYGDNTLAGLPPHLIRAELCWETRAGYYVGPTVEWVPQKTYIDHANTFSADPYALLGFKVGYHPATGWAWYIEAKNLLDETYAATTGVIANAAGADQRQFLPGDGRALYVGAEYRF